MWSGREDDGQGRQQGPQEGAEGALAWTWADRAGQKVTGWDQVGGQTTSAGTGVKGRQTAIGVPPSLDHNHRGGVCGIEMPEQKSCVFRWLGTVWVRQYIGEGR